jgi:hypothetical protein
MAKFKNPNEPLQPKKGVYGWFVTKNKQPFFTLYIGCAGFKDTALPKGTLFRGVSELQKNTFSQKDNKGTYSYLDTDFVVGCCIDIIETRLNLECFWEHISDDPNDEIKFCLKYLPILQKSNGDIKKQYKFHDTIDKWTSKKTNSEKRLQINEAEKLIFDILIPEINSLRPNIAQHRIAGS